MREYRQVLLLFVMVFIFGILGVRLWILQWGATATMLAGQSTLAHHSVVQRRNSVVLDEGRGRILDRSSNPLAGIMTKALILLEPLTLLQANQLLSAVNVSGTAVDSLRGHAHYPAIWAHSRGRTITLNERQAIRIEQLHLPNIRIVPYVSRYPDRPIAAHLIGYTAQNQHMSDSLYGKLNSRRWKMSRNKPVGVAGLERTFERWLHSDDSMRYAVYSNGVGHSLKGIKSRITGQHNRFYPFHIMTTLDRGLQQQIEQLMDRSGVIDGAVVVLEAATGDVTAMASKPDYDPYSVRPEIDNWHNRAIMAHAPGSIFKTVVAAAALDAGIVHPGDKFECKGAWHPYRMQCHLPKGHGVITLEQAFAQSCNVVFAKLAVRLGARQLAESADKLGIGRSIGWQSDSVDTPIGIVHPFTQLDHEEAGQIFDPRSDQNDQVLVAQTGIGQRDVRMTPLQAAAMAAAVARGGLTVQPRVVSEVRTSSHHTLIEFPDQQRVKRAMSGRTARWLQHAMRRVVMEGTATALRDVPSRVAGKTGTAETGVRGMEHHWFVGYTPVEEPKYAFAVLVRNRNDHERHQALILAEHIARMLGAANK